MFKTRKLKLFLVFSLTIIFALVFFVSGPITGRANPFTEIEEKIAGFSEEEKQILEDLFILVQETEEMEREKTGITREIELLNIEIKSMVNKIAAGEKDYEKKKDILEQVLKSYQRSGPGTCLEIILDSDSLPDFLRRLNALRDLTKNTGKLLQSLEISSEKLTGEKNKLAEKLVLMEKKQAEIKKALAQKDQIKDDREIYLASLKDKREYYQTYLAEIQKEWDGLKPFFAEMLQGASRIIEEGYLEIKLPPDSMRITFSLTKIYGSINEAAFNQIVNSYADLPEMVFTFHPDNIEVSLPEKNLVLSGTLLIIDGHTLKFAPREGSFYGLPLEKASIEELFRTGDLIFNFQPLVGSDILNLIKIQDGYMEMELKRASF